MFGQMQTAIAAVGVAAGRAFEAIGSQVRGIEEGVGRAIGGTLKGIGGGLKGIGSAQYGGNILSPLIEGARGAVNAAVKSVNHLAQGVIEGMRSIVTGVTGLFGELAKTALMSVGGVIGAFTPVGPLVGAILGNAVGGLAKAVSDMATGAVNGVASILSGISAAVAGALQGVVNVAGAILNSLVGIAQGGAERSEIETPIRLLVFLREAAHGVEDRLPTVLVRQGLDTQIQFLRLLRFLFDFLLPHLEDQRVRQTPLDAHRLRKGRVRLAHVALQREAGVRLLEGVAGRAGSPAEGALLVLLAVDHVLVAAGALRRGVLAGVDRDEDVRERIPDHTDARPRRVVAAPLRNGMEGGADHLAAPATVALVDVDHDPLDDLLLLFGHASPPPPEASFAATASSVVRIPLLRKSSAT